MVRTQALVMIRREKVGTGGLLDGHGRDHAARAHCAKNGQYLPVALGRSFVNARASKAARTEPRHLWGDTAFVQINQAFRRGRADFFKELRTPLLVGFGVPLRGVERLFFSRSPSFRSRYQTRPRLSWTCASFNNFD